MYNDTLITLKEPKELLNLNFDAICNTNKLQPSVKNMPINDFVDIEVNRILYFFTQQLDSIDVYPTLIRVREDDTITIRTILGKLEDCDLATMVDKLNARKAYTYVNTYRDNRATVRDGIQLLFENNQLIMLVNRKITDIFSKIITDRNAYQEVKSTLWNIGAKIAKDIHHTCFSFTYKTRAIEIKCNDIDMKKLIDFESNSLNRLKINDKEVVVAPHRIIYNL